MKRKRCFTAVAWLAVFALSLLPQSAWACAACFGQSDSKQASALNWGIFTLLGFVVMVLGGFASFMICLARRSAAATPEEEPPAQT